MKFLIKSYNLKLDGSNLFVDLTSTEDKNRHYRIWKDERHPGIEEIERHLRAAFNKSIADKSKIDISDYVERMYVFIKTSIPYHSDQFSAEKLKTSGA